MADNLTMHADLVNAEILTDMLSAQLPKAVRFTPFIPIDTTMMNRGGDTITIPHFNYVGPALNFAEGEKINYEELTTDTKQVTVKKAGQGIKLTDEAMMNSWGDPVAEAVRQIRMALVDKIEQDIVTAALAAKLTMDYPRLDVGMVNAVEGFFYETPGVIEDEIAGVTGYIFMNPIDAGLLMENAMGNWTRASELGDAVLRTGTFGQILGWNIIRSMRVTRGTIVAMKPGAMRLYLNRHIMAETGRDIDYKFTKFNADCHYVPAIVNDSLAMTVNITGEPEVPGGPDDEETRSASGHPLGTSEAKDDHGQNLKGHDVLPDDHNHRNAADANVDVPVESAKSVASGKGKK